MAVGVGVGTKGMVVVMAEQQDMEADMEEHLGQEAMVLQLPQDHTLSHLCHQDLLLVPRGEVVWEEVRTWEAA